MPEPITPDARRVGERHRPLLIAGAFLLSALLVLWAALGLRHIEATDLTSLVTVSICDDGIMGPGEVCDNGAGNNLGLYASTTADRTCAPDCFSFGPYCGDGILQVRFSEQCDDGNNTDGDLCTASCQSTAVSGGGPQGSPTVGGTPFIPNATPGNILSDKETRVVLRGKAFPLSVVTILLDGKTLGSVTADANADFLFSTSAVSPGTATFGFSARDPGGAVTLLIAPESAPEQLKTYAATTSATGARAGAWSITVPGASLSRGVYLVRARVALSSEQQSDTSPTLRVGIGQVVAGGMRSDLNKDGKVNLVDFSILLTSWGASGAGDINEDGTTNLADFSIMLFDWTG